jgi:hypothetical protein
MSGPKVVRIVTRDEILAVCRGQLARVDAALADWTRIGLRNGCVDDDAIAAAKRRREELASLIAADRFMDLQKQAPAEEAFLRDDIQARLASLAAERARARSRATREREAGRALLRALKGGGQPVAGELAVGLEQGNRDALSEALSILSERTAGAAVASELAAALREEGGRHSLAEWLARQPGRALDPAVERISARIDELGSLVDPDTAAGWRARLDEAEDAPPARRSLLLDGLEVGTARALGEARRTAALAAELRALGAELAAAGVPAPAADAEASDPQELEAGIARAREALEADRAARAAAARRAAVLEGLAALGYEVTEGMSTIFASEGRLVVRSAARAGYGMEVSAGGGGERMQMRAVAFTDGGHGPDPSRDRDAETIWCGDVATLERRLASAGGGLSIERALPVGATALKRIETGAPPRGTAVATPALKERTRS